jgi:anti-anti-sigma regulatory factor
MSLNTLNVTHSETDKTFVGSLVGELTIATAGQLKLSLLSMETDKPMVLSLAQVTAIDLACIQVLYAWKHTLLTVGKKVQILLPEGEALKELLEKTGITKLI